MDARSVALAYGLSTISGLRASLTIFAVALAINAGWLAPPQSLAWLGADWIVWVAGAFTLLDFLGDKVPVVDHALQASHMFLAPVSGALAAGATDPTGGWSLWAVAGIGALNALGVHAAKTTTRLGGSAASLGTLTPAMSLVEDLLAVGGLALAAFSPYALVAVIALLAVAIVALVRRWQLRAAVRRI